MRKAKMKLSKEQVETAADWWVEALRNPKFDNGDNSMASLTAGNLATAASILNPLKEETLAVFRKMLVEQLSKDAPFFIEGKGRFPEILKVDYNPEGVLFWVAHNAGINTRLTSFPWKTTMRFTGGGVKVACGYGSDYEDLPLKDTSSTSVQSNMENSDAQKDW
jgi:hypothetical protein